MKKMNRKGGFTLIELLVVIAIIGILSSVVLVSLNSARKKGTDARVVSDVQQIRTALESGYNGSGYPDLKNDGNNANSNANATCITNGWNNQGGQNAVINQLMVDACTQGVPSDIIINTNAGAVPQTYAIYGKLSSGVYMCIDSTGKTNQAENNNAATTCQ